MKAWFGQIAGILCIMTVILQLLPEGNFAKYVRFYASLLYLLVVTGPLLRLFSQEDLLERFLRLELLKEEYYNLETSVEGLEDLKNDSFQAACRRELVRQFGEIVSVCGAQMADASLLFSEDNTLQEVSIKITDENLPEGTARKIREEIAGIYALKPENIRIEGLGDG